MDAGVQFTLKFPRARYTKREKEAKSSGIGNIVVPALDCAESYMCSSTFATKKEEQRKRASFKGLSFVCNRSCSFSLGFHLGPLIVS